MAPLLLDFQKKKVLNRRDPRLIDEESPDYLSVSPSENLPMVENK
jgi:hypothetical protein